MTQRCRLNPWRFNQPPDAEPHSDRSTGTSLLACRHDVATDRSHHTSIPRLPASGLSSVLSPQGHLKCLLIQHGFGKQLLESGVLFLKRLQALNLGHLRTAILLMPGIIGGVGNGVLAAELTGRNPCFSFAEDTDDLFVGKTLLHGDVLMWLMKTLLTSRCINQWGAGQAFRCAVRITPVSAGGQSRSVSVLKRPPGVKSRIW